MKLKSNQIPWIGLVGVIAIAASKGSIVTGIIFVATLILPLYSILKGFDTLERIAFSLALGALIVPTVSYYGSFLIGSLKIASIVTIIILYAVAGYMYFRNKGKKDEE